MALINCRVALMCSDAKLSEGQLQHYNAREATTQIYDGTY